MESATQTGIQQHSDAQIILIVHVEDDVDLSETFADGLKNYFNKYLLKYTSLFEADLPFDLQVIHIKSYNDFNQFLSNDIEQYQDYLINFIVDIRLGSESDAGFKIAREIFEKDEFLFDSTYIFSVLNSTNYEVREEIKQLFKQKDLSGNIFKKGSARPVDLLCKIMNKISDHHIQAEQLDDPDEISLENTNFNTARISRDSQNSSLTNDNKYTCSFAIVEKIISNENDYGIIVDDNPILKSYHEISVDNFRYSLFYSKSFLYLNQKSSIGWASPNFTWKVRIKDSLIDNPKYLFALKRYYLANSNFPVGIGFPSLKLPSDFLVLNILDLKKNLKKYIDWSGFISSPLENNIAINFFLIKCAEFYVRIEETTFDYLEILDILDTLEVKFIEENSVFKDSSGFNSNYLKETFIIYVWEISCFVFKSTKVARDKIFPFHKLTSNKIVNVIYGEILEASDKYLESLEEVNQYVPVNLKSLDLQSEEVSRLLHKEVILTSDQSGRLLNESSCFKMIRFSQQLENNLYHSLNTYIEPLLNIQYSNFNFFI